MDSILIFGGGLNQVTLIQSAKDLGYKTIVIDPLENAPGKSIADVFKVVGPKDYSATKEIALEYGVKGIVSSQMDNPVMMMAKLAAELNFIFPSEQSVLNARNKFMMKQCFLKSGVPCAKGKLVSSTEIITEELCNEIGFPLIIKPLDSFSSRGVFKINDFEEISNYLSSTRNFSSTGDILIEEFMEGNEVSVESVTQNGITTIVQITDKIITSYPTAVEMAHIQPSELDLLSKQKVNEIVKNAIAALGLDNCAGHSEVKITKEGPKMVEVGARLGGDYITSHLVPMSTGVNMEAAVINIAMGKKPDLEHTLEKASAIRYLKLPDGKKIKKIEDWNYLYKNKSIKNIYFFIKENEIVPPITDSAKRAGCIIVQDVDRPAVLNTSEKAIEDLAKCFHYN